MGNLFKSKTIKTKNPFETNPWKAQQSYLTKGFSSAGTALDEALAYNQSNSVPDWTANLTNEQQGLLNSTMSAGQGIQGASGQITNTGANLASGGNQYLANANRLASTAGSFDGGGIAGYNNSAQALLTKAGQNQTGNIIADAGQYANNPYLQQNIDAALNDVSKTLATDIGGINQAAAGSGNINSTRAGVMEAQARDNAANTAANLSSSMRMNAYNTGLGMAQSENARQISDSLSANEAVASGIGFGLGANQQNFNQSLAANEQLGNAANLGTNMASAGYQLGQAGRAESQSAADRFQAQNQAEITGLLSRNDYNQQNTLNLIQQYMAAIGGNYGSSGYTTTTHQNASPLQQIAGMASSAAGIYGGFR